MLRRPTARWPSTSCRGRATWRACTGSCATADVQAVRTERPPRRVGRDAHGAPDGLLPRHHHRRRHGADDGVLRRRARDLQPRPEVRVHNVPALLPLAAGATTSTYSYVPAVMPPEASTATCTRRRRTGGPQPPRHGAPERRPYLLSAGSASIAAATAAASLTRNGSSSTGGRAAPHGLRRRRRAFRTVAIIGVIPFAALARRPGAVLSAAAPSVSETPARARTGTRRPRARCRCSPTTRRPRGAARGRRRRGGCRRPFSPAACVDLRCLSSR